MNEYSATQLNTLAIILAQLISDNIDQKDIGIYGAFFTVLGDALATIAASA